MPVMLAPGRAKLDTRPAPTGSPLAMTIGTLDVARARRAKSGCPGTSTSLDALVGLAARTRDSNSGKELPAGSAGLCTRETRHGPQQGLHGMCRRQIDREASCIELIVPLGVFNRG